MNEDDAEADIYSVFNKIMLNGHAEMFTNIKSIPKILENYKTSNIDDVEFLI